MISLNYTYCPICFNNSLTLKPTGKISILLNGKPSSHGQLLYNLNSQEGHEIKKEFLVKMEEYFKWYGDLNNAESISKLTSFQLTLFVTMVAVSPRQLNPQSSEFFY